MPISRKPKDSSQFHHNQIEGLINKGGSVAKKEETQNLDTPVMLRIPVCMKKQIAEVLEKKTIKKPRHTWILEAIAEKLEREKAQT